MKTEKKKPHVAILVPDSLKKTTGGLGVYVNNIRKYLKDDFVFSFHGYDEENQIKNYFRTKTILPDTIHGGIRSLTNQTEYAKSILENVKPDIIHAVDHTVYQAGICASEILKVPLVTTLQISSIFMAEAGVFHAFDPRSLDGFSIQKAFQDIEILGIKKANQVIQISKQYKERYKKIPGIDEKTTYIPNGIDLNDFKNLKKVDLPGNGKKKVIFIGRFSAEKNIIELINSEIPNEIDLIFIGDLSNNQPNVLEEFKKIERIKDNIHYMGPVFGQDKNNILHSADALILPSLQECSPLVMYEALASKTIFISSNVGDIPNIVPEDVGIDCGTKRYTIGKALRDFSNMKDDEIERRVEKGYEIIKKYTLDKFAERTKEVYLKTLRV